MPAFRPPLGDSNKTAIIDSLRLRYRNDSERFAGAAGPLRHSSRWVLGASYRCVNICIVECCIPVGLLEQQARRVVRRLPVGSVVTDA